MGAEPFTARTARPIAYGDCLQVGVLRYPFIYAYAKTGFMITPVREVEAYRAWTF